MTPFVKNLTLKQIIFTYLIPIVPLIYAWDGQASLVRMYTFKDIEKYYDFKRSGDIRKGDVSEEFYIQWMETKDQKLFQGVNRMVRVQFL